MKSSIGNGGSSGASLSSPSSPSPPSSAAFLADSSCHFEVNYYNESY